MGGGTDGRSEEVLSQLRGIHNRDGGMRGGGTQQRERRGERRRRNTGERDGRRERSEE